MKIFLLAVTLFLTAPVAGFAQTASTKKTLKLVTHVASPMMDSKLPGGGAVSDSLRKVLKKMGYDLEVVFVSSWARAKIMAQKDKTLDGYFPYMTLENENVFVFSDLFLESPWVIVERKEAPIAWNKPEDLIKFTGGNVTGVELRPGIKELAQAGKLKIENTSSEIYNIQKLINKRVDYIFIDPFVYEQAMQKPQVRAFQDKLQINAKPIAINRYGVAFKKSHVSQQFLEEFNRANDEAMKLLSEYNQRLKSPAK